MQPLTCDPSQCTSTEDKQLPHISEMLHDMLQEMKQRYHFSEMLHFALSQMTKTPQKYSKNQQQALSPILALMD